MTLAVEIPAAVAPPVRPPARLELPADEVHLWQASMIGKGDPSLLPPDELARARRLLIPAIRERFIRSRTLLRSVLAAYTGRRPDELRLASSGQGKPFLAEEGSVRFNLSRTDAVWMLAVALDREVGVDVERLDRPVDPDALAARLFSRKECATLLGLAGPDKARAFFRAWACREATVKAMGEGMFSHSGRFEVEADPDLPVGAWPVDGAAFPWRLGIVPTPPDHVSVVAVEGEPSAIRNRWWA